MSHSKRNTSLAFFTAHERAQLRGWGAQSARLAADQALPFAACTLCLRPAVRPVACPGFPTASPPLPAPASPSTTSSSTTPDRIPRACHIFCRECAVAALLAQKQDRARAAARRAAHAATGALEAQAREDADAAAALQEFEATQAGLPTARGEKRKRSDEGGAPFWMPGARGTGAGGDVGVETKGTVCPGGGGHGMSLKTLVGVEFCEEAGGGRVCPACGAALRNASRAVVGRPCGHVVCGACCARFVRDGEDGVVCFVCQESLEEEDAGAGKDAEAATGKKTKRARKTDRPARGLMEICCEGTGFARAGKSEVKKSGTAFAFG